jgi:dephospho-CoA kinase
MVPTKYFEDFFEIKDLISAAIGEIPGVTEQYFVTGPHASGKSVIAKLAWKDSDDTLFFDTGPILRQYKSNNGPESEPFNTWLEEYENRYGDEFTDKLLAAHIYKNILNNPQATRIIIIGNRSFRGVSYLQKNIKVPYSKLIYVTAPAAILYERYKKREGKHDFPQNEFGALLISDNKRGLEQIQSRADFLLPNTQGLGDAVKSLQQYIKDRERG